MSPPRADPPGLDALAQAVARYQAQLAEQRRAKRTTKEIAIRAGKQAGASAAAIAIAVALSQAIQSIWGIDARRVEDRLQAARTELTQHHAELERLKIEASACKAGIEALRLSDLEFRAALQETQSKRQAKRSR